MVIHDTKCLCICSLSVSVRVRCRIQNWSKHNRLKLKLSQVRSMDIFYSCFNELSYVQVRYVFHHFVNARFSWS